MVVTIVKAISEYVADVTVAYLGHRFVADLRIQMFARLARADLSFIQTVHSGRLLSGFLNDSNLIRQTASRSIVTLGENYLKVIILVATMFYMDARFAFMILVCSCRSPGSCSGASAARCGNRPRSRCRRPAICRR